MRDHAIIQLFIVPHCHLFAVKYAFGGESSFLAGHNYQLQELNTVISADGIRPEDVDGLRAHVTGTTGLYSDFVVMTSPEEKSASAAAINQAIAGATAATLLVKTYTKKKGGSKKRKAAEEPDDATTEGTLIGPPLGLWDEII